MKKILVKIVGVVVLLFFACGEKQTPTIGASPGEVAITLFSAITSGNTQVVKDNIYISDDVQRDVFFDWIDMAAASPQYAESTKGYTPSYTADKTEIDGDNATVELVGKDPAGNLVRITVKLLKVDSRWKVDGDHGVWH